MTTTSRDTVHLTRRGRLLLVLLLAGVVFAAFSFGRSSSSQASGEVQVPVAPSTTSVVVQEGDTLWDLAREVAPTADPRSVVERIRDLNGLQDGLRAGQVLVLPVAA